MTTIHDANVKYPIGTDVYDVCIEYRNIFYYATVNNTHPSKKQPASKKYKQKSSTNFRQGYGIFRTLRWMQKNK